MYRHSNLKLVDLVNHGLDLMNQGEYKKAIDVFEKAIKIDSKHFIPWSNLGLSYLELGDYDKAIEILKHAVQL
ncbi:MAG: tetratricopeptide repeat protein [Patescibacteria group bacterium]|nr:tetratricopeptide repeat protein [Patescibacteria group bacterium]